MELRWPAALVVVAVLVVVLLAWWSRRGRPRGGSALLVAHVERLRALPRHRALVRRRQAVGALLTLGALVLVSGAAVVLARPQGVELVEGQSRSRDLVLCLDASTSMDDDNVAVVRAVREVLAGLDDVRVGLTLWSGAAVTVFPLTDDLAYADQQLALAQDAFAGKQESFFTGVQLSEPRSSLIGDGVVSCVQRFDAPEQRRSRAVLISSDNDPRGEGVYDLAGAASYAAERDVVLYGIGAPELARAGTARTRAREGFAAATATTGGGLEIVGADGSTDALVAGIDALERQRVAQPPRPLQRDDPTPGVVLAAVGLGLIALGWLLAGLLAAADGLWSWRRRARGAA